MQSAQVTAPTKEHVTCDGCPVENADPYVVAGTAIMFDGRQKYVAYGIECRQIIRAGESDVKMFLPNEF